MMSKGNTSRMGLACYGLWSLVAFGAATFCLFPEAAVCCSSISHSDGVPLPGPGAERYAQAASPFGSIPPPPDNLPIKNVPVTPMEKAGPPPGLNPLKGMEKAEPPPHAGALTPMEKTKPEAGKELAPPLGSNPAVGKGASAIEEKAGVPGPDDNTSQKSKE
jgi:hypothetical protein